MLILFELINLFNSFAICQELERGNMIIYCQTLEGLMNNDFVDKQCELINANKIIEAEEEYINIGKTLIDSISYVNIDKYFYALACLHTFVLNNDSIGCSIFQLGRVFSKDGVLPNIFRTHFRFCYDDKYYSFNLLKNKLSQDNSSDTTLLDICCRTLKIYCNKKIYSTEENSLTSSEAFVFSISSKNKELAMARIEYYKKLIQLEEQKFNNIHENFPLLFRRTSLRQNINKEYFSLKASRKPEKTSLQIELILKLPNELPDKRRADITQKIFDTFFGTIAIFEDNYHGKFGESKSAALIEATNRDLDHAAISSKRLEDLGINAKDIHFENLSIDNSMINRNDYYRILLTSRDFLQNYFNKYRAREKEYLKEIEYYERLLNEVQKN